MTRRYDSDAAVEARVNEIEAWRTAPVDPPVLPATRPAVCLTKRVPIDAEWIRRHRTTPAEAERLVASLREQYGPGVQITLGGAR
jgi:hypothetical protein